MTREEQLKQVVETVLVRMVPFLQQCGLSVNWEEVGQRVEPDVESCLADDPYGTCFCGEALDAEGRCTKNRRHTA